MLKDFVRSNGEEFKRLRVLADLTLKECSEIIGLTPGYISRLENGDYTNDTVIIWESRLLLNKDVRERIEHNLKSCSKLFYKRPENMSIEELEARISEALKEVDSLIDVRDTMLSRQAAEKRQKEYQDLWDRMYGGKKDSLHDEVEEAYKEYVAEYYGL